jgi:hypothetical protein
MKFSRIIATGLAAFAASLTTSGFINACEQCRGRTACQACAGTDDQGLLDTLNAAAKRMQPRLPRWSPPRLPSLDTALRQALGGLTAGRGCASCGCEMNGPTCGCELQEPTCGCELREPTCGCELREPSCGFESHPSHSTSMDYHQHVHDPAPVPIPVPRETTPQSNAPYVVPQPVPLPDREVDPFRDDSASHLRRTPTRTIQYRQTRPTYRQTFDPQASHDGVQLRTSDSLQERVALNGESSRRPRPQVNPPSQTSVAGSSEEFVPAEVVTASATMPRRLTQTARALPTQPHRTEEIPNPLRSR